MTERKLAADWSYGAEESLEDKLYALEDVDLRTGVTIRLVGFTGKHGYSAQVDSLMLLRYLEAFNIEDHINVLYPPSSPVGDDPVDPLAFAVPRDPHRLRLVNKFVFHVEHAHAGLATKISESIQSRIDSEESYSVDFPFVDQHISSDYASKPTTDYVIYLLNPTPPDNGDVQYTYRPLSNKHRESGWSPDYEHSGTTTPCETVMFIGEGSSRYLWIDLTAGPVSYGPTTYGEGLVTEWTIPRITTYFGPSSMYRSGASATEALAASLASLSRKSVDHLMTPPLHFRPRKAYKKIHIQVHVFTYDSTLTPAGINLKGVLDWDAIKAQLTMINLPFQDLGFTEYVHQIDTCETCAATLLGSKRSHVSTVNVEGLTTQVHSYLDSATLHAYLAKFRSEWVRAWRKPGEEVYPIYLFDLSNTEEIILLDRFHQAMAFEDMVIAVRTSAGRTLLDYTCDVTSPLRMPGSVGNHGEALQPAAVTMDTQDASRAVLAATLSSVFSVASPTRTWAEVHGHSMEDWLFGTVPNPFSPFSPSLKVTWAQRDAARRNSLFSVLDEGMAEVEKLLGHFASYGISVDDVLDDYDATTFLRRWNLYTFKLHRVGTMLSVHDYAGAYYYVASARHDAQALHTLVHDAGRRVQTYYKCFKPAPVSIIQRATGTVTAVVMAGAVGYALYRSASWLRSILGKSSGGGGSGGYKKVD